MTSRPVGGVTYTLGYDTEGHLVSVTGGSYSAQFTYDDDGQRVQSLINGETIVFVGGYYEVKNPGAGQQITKSYLSGSTRVAQRRYAIPQNMTVEYLLGDHLGSTSLTTDSAGTKVSELRYTPWGEVRYSWVDPALTTTPAYQLTKWTFTGQYSYADDPTTPGVEDFGLLYFNARWVDPELGRFAQADTIIPGEEDPSSWDRYAFVNNDPTIHTDPTGHMLVNGGNSCSQNCSVTHSVLIGKSSGFPIPPGVGTTSYGQQVDETSCKGCSAEGQFEPPTWAGVPGLGVDVAAGGSLNCAEHCRPKLFVFLDYEEYENQDIKVDSLTFVNKDYLDYSVRSVSFTVDSPGNLPNRYSYNVSRPIYSASGNIPSSIGVAKGNAITTVSLLPSGNLYHPYNTFTNEESVQVFTQLLINNTTNHIYPPEAYRIP